MAGSEASTRFSVPLTSPGKSALFWLVLVLVGVSLGLIYYDGLTFMVEEWGRPEYSYGYIVPFIAAFMVWRDWGKLRAEDVTARWLGLPIVLVSILLYMAGQLATIYTLVQYSFILTLFGLCVAFFGWRNMRHLWPAIAFLWFMIPLPSFLYAQLSAKLQLISSSLGVALVRLAGISVYLEGNVIDLGTYKLQVIEACSGLRYLFPLMSFGFLFAYLYRGRIWQKGVLFLSTIPISVLMNCFRIGVIGILVEYQGNEAAEGFVHDFEGWVVFMACVGLLFLEVWLFAALDRSSGGLREAFVMSPERSSAGLGPSWIGRLPPPFAASCAALVALAGVAFFFQQRPEIVPEARPLALFPMELGDWTGRPAPLGTRFIEGLELDDYLLANYGRGDGKLPINLYVAYYGSQRSGIASHSPRSCIPGGGWQLSDIETRTFPDLGTRNNPLQVNRVLISKDRDRQLVYYWFDQRGRKITNEYMVKWYIFWDALTRNRTDGSLVRVIAPLSPGEPAESGDRRLADFLKRAYPELQKALPQ